MWWVLSVTISECDFWADHGSVVIFFDELDALIPRRDDGQSESAARGLTPHNNISSAIN